MAAVVVGGADDHDKAVGEDDCDGQNDSDGEGARTVLLLVLLA